MGRLDIHRSFRGFSAVLGAWGAGLLLLALLLRRLLVCLVGAAAVVDLEARDGGGG